MSDKSAKQKRSRVSKYTDEQAKAALVKVDGNQSEAAKILGVTRQTLNQRINETPALKDLCGNLIEVRLDKYERALDDLRDSKNATAILFYLKTIGRHRGFIEHAPIEDMNTAKLNAYREMFAAIGSKPRPGVQKILDAAPEPLEPPPTTPDEPGDLHSCKEKSAQPKTNFP